MRFGRKGTWIAFAFFCLMEMAAFPYSALAYTPSGDVLSPVDFLNDVNCGGEECNVRIVGEGIDITGGPCVTGIPIHAENIILSSGSYDWYENVYAGGSGCTELGSSLLISSFDVIEPLAEAEATTTLVIASLGAVLWDEVVSNILTIISICTAVALIFFAFNAFKRWTK